MVFLIYTYFLSVISAFKPRFSNKQISIIKSPSLFLSSSPHLPVNHDKVKYDAIVNLEEKMSSLKRYLDIVCEDFSATEVELNEEKDRINKVDTEIDKISSEIEGLSASDTAILYKSDRKRKLEERKEKLVNRRDRLEDTRNRLDEERFQLTNNEWELRSVLGKCRTCI